MDSMFVKDLKKRGEERLSMPLPGEKSAKEYLESWDRIARSRSIILAAGSTVLGGLAYGLMGYISLTSSQNLPFLTGNLIPMLIMGTVLGIASWLISSAACRLLWKLLGNDSKETSVTARIIFVEGMPEIAYLLLFPVFLVLFLLFGSFEAMMVVPLGLAARLALEWRLLGQCLTATNSDKILLLACHCMAAAAGGKILKMVLEVMM